MTPKEPLQKFLKQHKRLQQKKDIPIIDVRDLPVGDFQVMTDDEAMKYIQTHAEWKHDPYPMEEYIKNNKKRAEELDDLKHNYKALEEFYNNSVAYGTKIQNELNELNHDVARFIELTFSDDINSDDWQEYLSLKNKLSKVGKEK